MRLTSPAFKHNQGIPPKYTCDGQNVNPALKLEDIPEICKSLALIVDDPDAPGKTWVHWVVYDIPVTSKIGEDEIPGKQGFNDFDRRDYGGPCPPSGAHRYFFKVYALDEQLNIDGEINKADLEMAMDGHILDNAELIGLYEAR